MSAQVMPAKRPLDENLTDVNGRRKLQKSSSDNTPYTAPPSSKVIRVLCPASKIDGIIGNDCNNISQICQETGAGVHIEESVPGCDEIVIVIAQSDKGEEIVNGQIKAEGEETKIPDEHDEGFGSEKEKENSAIQKALLAVFEKMVDILSDIKEGDEESNKSSSIVVRLLVFSSQVGCLLGKAGSVIKQMSSESGAQIRILPKDKLPSCASSSDELVQISGGLAAIRKALLSVSQQLIDHNLRNQDPVSATVVGPPPKQDKFTPRNRPFHGHGAPYPPAFHDAEHGIPGRMNFHPETLTFRLLCNEEKIGGVIGKGGSIVKALQHESGCDIKVLEGTGDAEDRIIIVSGPAHPDDALSPPQDAVLRVQSRIFRSAPESKDNTMIAKLLVASHQIGCLLGKGGSVIAEMRKTTGAYIRILGKDLVPKNASENEEVVQVTGEFEVVQEALVQITSRLKNHLFRNIFPPLNPAFTEQMPLFPPPYMARRDFSPSGGFSNRGPPFNKFDGPGGPHPGDGFHPHDDQPPYMHDYPRPGVHPHMPERMPSAAPWRPQGPMGVPGPMGFPDYPGGPQRRFGGFSGGNQPTLVTNTTMEVVVPRFVVPALCGEDGCLEDILELSEAKITITDPKPGASETKIIISGAPDQAYAAQSLIQALVILESGGAS